MVAGQIWCEPAKLRFAEQGYRGCQRMCARESLLCRFTALRILLLTWAFRRQLDHGLAHPADGVVMQGGEYGVTPVEQRAWCETPLGGVS